MSKAVALLLAGAALAGSAIAQASDDRMDLVTILTAPDAETQLMAMVLTMQAMEQGAKVHVLLCGPAGDIALADAPESATAPQQPRGLSPQGLMTAIIAAGGTVEVCAIYLPNRGVGPEVLIEDVTAARPPAMAARLLADDTRIMSF